MTGWLGARLKSEPKFFDKNLNVGAVTVAMAKLDASFKHSGT